MKIRKCLYTVPQNKLHNFTKHAKQNTFETETMFIMHFRENDNDLDVIIKPMGVYIK